MQNIHVQFFQKELFKDVFRRNNNHTKLREKNLIIPMGNLSLSI